MHWIVIKICRLLNCLVHCYFSGCFLTFFGGVITGNDKLFRTTSCSVVAFSCREFDNGTKKEGEFRFKLFVDVFKFAFAQPEKAKTPLAKRYNRFSVQIDLFFHIPENYLQIWKLYPNGKLWDCPQNHCGLSTAVFSFYS